MEDRRSNSGLMLIFAARVARDEALGYRCRMTETGE